MIAIVDYQMGNLRSVQKALEKVGHAGEITSDPRILTRAERFEFALPLREADD